MRQTSFYKLSIEHFGCPAHQEDNKLIFISQVKAESVIVWGDLRFSLFDPLIKPWSGFLNLP